MANSSSRPSIYEIARRVGVSHVTVARAFSGKVPVAEQTRQRIFAKAQQMGYTPNLLARGLNGGRTNTVGVLWSMAGPHDTESVTRRIARAAQRREHITHMADHLSDPDLTIQLLDGFLQRGVDAVVMEDGVGRLGGVAQIRKRIKQFRAAVIVAPAKPARPYCDMVIRDLTRPLRQAVRHLIASGRQRLGYLVPAASGARKIEAVLGEIAAAGLNASADDNIIPVDGRDMDEAMQALRKRCRNGRIPFDALLCSTDEIAIAAISDLADRGLRVPQDVAVIGFNDSTFARFTRPRIATVNRQDEAVTALIEELLFSQLDQPGESPRLRSVSMRFVWRESAGGEAPTPLEDQEVWHDG